MGRGDKKTAKGKRFQGSFGKSRPHKVATKGKKATATVETAKTSALFNLINTPSAIPTNQ